MLAIDVKNLTKQFNAQKNREGVKGALKDLFRREYNQITAVDDISFQIPKGEICGYIGENGAGKSTTIKMLTGILVPLLEKFMLMASYHIRKERNSSEALA
jgi:ABC-2 type transport system ATP-binding protein